MQFIDLCCGIGGFHQALSNMGMVCVLASDIDKECRANYMLNYNINPYADIKDIDIKNIPYFDVLCAGFPCQPFSKAGQQQGFEDERGNVFFDICKIIEHHRPKYLILENVRNLSTHDGGNTWRIIHQKLDELNYNLYNKPTILNTLYFGVPQSRERVVILCKRKDLGTLPILHIDKKNNSCLSDIIEEKYDQKYNIAGKTLITKNVWNNFLTIINVNNIVMPRFPLWTDWWDSDGNDTKVTKADKKLSEAENKVNIEKKQKEFYAKYKTCIDKNRKFYNDNKTILSEWLITSREIKEWVGAVRKLEWQASNGLSMDEVLWSTRGSGIRVKDITYSPTLVAMASMIPVYGPLSRHLTPRECARLQSFPSTYILHSNDKIAYKQLGNAVNVKMIEKSARFLIYNELFL